MTAALVAGEAWSVAVCIPSAAEVESAPGRILRTVGEPLEAAVAAPQAAE